jgi:hypothetical protein
VEQSINEWDRQALTRHACGRPPTSGQGIFRIRKAVSRASATALLRGHQLLRDTALDGGSPFLHVVQYLSLASIDPDSRIFTFAPEHKKRFVRVLSELISPPHERSPPASRLTFSRHIKGFLKLWLKPRWRHDHLDLFIDEDGEFSIVHGCWIDRRAPSILQNRAENRISCIMLDTTWSVLRQYVTAIMVAVSRNTAIPLAVAFGHVEDFELYDQFWVIFHEQFGIDLSSFIVLSDQGSVLRKFAHEHHFVHRLCLRHFLAK